MYLSAVVVIPKRIKNRVVREWSAMLENGLLRQGGKTADWLRVIT